MVENRLYFLITINPLEIIIIGMYINIGIQRPNNIPSIIPIIVCHTIILSSYSFYYIMNRVKSQPFSVGPNAPCFFSAFSFLFLRISVIDP